MRDIKFRIRNTVNGNVDYVTLEHLLTNDQSNVSAKNVNDDFQISQYTGLKDKNGVEIYEGDILSEPTSPVGGKNGGYKYTAREIRWEGAGSGYKLFAPNVSSEVIGNIYENPELLEKSC